MAGDLTGSFSAILVIERKAELEQQQHSSICHAGFKGVNWKLMHRKDVVQ